MLFLLLRTHPTGVFSSKVFLTERLLAIYTTNCLHLIVGITTGVMVPVILELPVCLNPAWPNLVHRSVLGKVQQ